MAKKPKVPEDHHECIVGRASLPNDIGGEGGTNTACFRGTFLPKLITATKIYLLIKKVVYLTIDFLRVRFID